MLGVPKDVIVKETEAANTREHARNLYPMLQERGFRRVLLVTSAIHMPRSVGVFHKLCPEIEFIPAPTGFRVVEGPPKPWYQMLPSLLPTPRSLLNFCEVEHEYVGMAYYKLRGWM